MTSLVAQVRAQRARLAGWALAALVSGLAAAHAQPAASPPPAAAPAEGRLTAEELASLSKAAHGEDPDRVLALLSFERLRCAFSEEKQVALLKRPLRSSGFIVFDKQKGIARHTLEPRPALAVVTRTTLRLTRGKRVEVIALDKSKDLRAFALVLPALLRGDREELERSFELVVLGSAKGRWALRLTPRSESLRKLVRQVTVVGKGGTLALLDIEEASGDRSRTWLSEQRQGGEVTGEELAAAFGGA